MGTGDRAEADRPGDAGRDVTGTDGIESAEFALEDGQPLAEEDDEPREDERGQRPRAAPNAPPARAAMSRTTNASSSIPMTGI